MNELISRSELINTLKVHFDSCFREDGELLYSDHICTSDDVVDLIKLVENQPTAYDIDNVVEDLETDFSIKLYGSGNSDNYLIPVKRAIEIVKQGGVSDDVCEWEIFDNSLTDEPQWVYETACGKYVEEEHTSKEFVYCPYCSKKIKVVESD